MNRHKAYKRNYRNPRNGNGNRKINRDRAYIKTNNVESEDYNLVLKKLQNYMLSNDIMEQATQHLSTRFNSDRKMMTKKQEKLQEKQNQKETTLVKETKKTTLYPQYKDSLFWCYYILANSIDDFTFMEMTNKHFEIEKETKIKLVTLLRDKKDDIKRMKLKRTDLEDELVNETTISINTFLAICNLKDIHVLIVKDKIFYEIGEKEGDKCPNVVVYNTKDEKYGINLEESNDKVAEYRDTLWKVESISKPVRGISYYKLNDLQDICTRVGIDITVTLETKTKNKTKMQLYEELVQKLSS